MGPDPTLCPVVQRSKIEYAFQAPKSPLNDLQLLVAFDHQIGGEIGQGAFHDELTVKEGFPATSLAEGTWSPFLGQMAAPGFAFPDLAKPGADVLNEVVCFLHSRLSALTHQRGGLRVIGQDELAPSRCSSRYCFPASGSV